MDLRGVAVADALSNIENPATVIAKQTSHSVQAVDIVLRDVQDRIGVLRVTSPQEFRRVRRRRRCINSCAAAPNACRRSTTLLWSAPTVSG
jgi:hypothetical protein